MVQILHAAEPKQPPTQLHHQPIKHTRHHTSCEPPPTISLQLGHHRLAGSWPHRDAAHRQAGPIVGHGAARAVGLHTNLVNLCSR